MPKITEEVLQVIAGDIEDLLLEQREGIAWAFAKMKADGMTVTVSVALDDAGESVSAELSVSYPLEPKQEPRQKQKVTKKRVIDLSQMALFEAVERLRPKKGSGIESVEIAAAGKVVKLEARS